MDKPQEIYTLLSYTPDSLEIWAASYTNLEAVQECLRNVDVHSLSGTVVPPEQVEVVDTEDDGVPLLTSIPVIIRTLAYAGFQ